jgi:hypothetical protein
MLVTIDETISEFVDTFVSFDFSALSYAELTHPTLQEAVSTIAVHQAARDVLLCVAWGFAQPL